MKLLLFLSVYYRMFAVTPRMEPVERNDETQTDASIAIEITVLYFNFDKLNQNQKSYYNHESLLKCKSYPSFHLCLLHAPKITKSQKYIH